MLHLILMNKIYISKFLYEISDRPVRSECDVQRSRLIVMIPDNLWPNISTMVVSKNKEFLFFCFLKSFVFLQKMETKNKKRKKSENSPKKPIKISNLNRFYTNISLRTDCYLVCSMNLAKIFDARAFLN